MFWSLNFSTTLPSSYDSGRPTFTLLDGSDRTLGIMKRSVPSVHRPRAPPIVVHAKANHEPKKYDRKPRRSSPFFGGAAAGRGAAAAGFGGGAAAAGAAAAPVVVCVAAGLMDSAGLSGVGFCSDMRPKLHGETRTARRPFVGGSL